jgi:MarR family transcriptional regulator for hemolysin
MAAEVDRDNFGVMLYNLSRLWRAKLDERLKPLGLSQAKWRVILHLSHAREGLVQKELAELLGIEGPSLVGLLDRMAADGWIERCPSLADRRYKVVHLTQKAQETARRIVRINRQLREELLMDLTPEDLAHCARIFGAITVRAQALEGPQNGTVKTTNRGKS